MGNKPCFPLSFPSLLPPALYQISCGIPDMHALNWRSNLPWEAEQDTTVGRIGVNIAELNKLSDYCTLK